MTSRLPDPPDLPRLPLRERLRRETYLLTLQLWLEDADYPARRREALVRQLRADLTDDAAARGLRAALRDLGPARTLARSYIDLEDAYRPRWILGLAWATGFWALCALATVVYLRGLLDGASTTDDRVTGRFLGATLELEDSATALSVELTASPWVLLVGIALFLAAARPWRAVPALRRRAERRSAPSRDDHGPADPYPDTAHVAGTPS